MSTDADRQLNDALHQGLAFHRAGNLAKAKELYQQVLHKQPRNFNALNLMGALLHEDDPRGAMSFLDQALAVNPESFAVHFNRGLVLARLGKWNDALASYDEALKRNPIAADIHTNRGIALLNAGRAQEALESHTQAIKLQPNFAAALVNRGNVFRKLKRHDAALADYERAILLQPQMPEAHNNRAAVLKDLDRLEEAYAGYEQAILYRPGYVDALAGRSDVLLDLRRYGAAAASYTDLLAVSPEYPFALGRHLLAKMSVCDWSAFDSSAAALMRELRTGKPVAEPFGYQAVSTSESDLLHCAEIYAARAYPPQPPCVTTDLRRRTGKIRLGYVSGEFRNQATSVLMAETWELHDKNRFEIYAFDNGWNDGSEVRRRIDAAFHEIVDISHMNDVDAARAIRERDIDILINLNGYFGKERQGIFAMRPAPVQVNYLGFPGTLGADYFDYLIADRIVIPEASRRFYKEKIVYLPQCYQANDGRRKISDGVFTRMEAGLPDAAFVFCCFNNNYKITPRTFDSWMRILKAVDGSVLWLLEDSPGAAVNLRREATARNISPDRLVFAPRMTLPQHLARHRLADLFIDTLPYNAHTTASDALWAGLPLLTFRGTTFPGRVAASLLTAIGIPELITETADAYEAKAIELATDEAQLKNIRDKLARNRLSQPLFDAETFTRGLEDVYESIMS